MGDIDPHMDVQVTRIRDRYLALFQANYSLPLTDFKQYRQGKVLLLYWDTDHLEINWQTG